MSLDRDLLAQTLESRGAFVRVSIAAHKGSAPRETGTAMLVWADGQLGTIGGGALEFDAVAEARRDPGPRLLQRPLGPALGQCCGGHVTLALEPITKETFAAIPETGLYARPIGGPMGAEPLTVIRAHAAVRRGDPVTTHLAEGWLIEPLATAPIPLWLYGAGHVGRAIVRTLTDLPVAVTWVDDAPERFPPGIPTHATRLLAADPVRAAAHAPHNAHHLVLTYSHALDLALCHAILQRPFASLGLIGSATKRARFLKRLRDMGHRPDRLSRLTCPIGDPALGKRPQAIAISVVHRLLLDQPTCAQGRNEDRA